MLGRGIIANPNLLGEIKHGNQLDLEVLRAFHDRLYSDYQHYARTDQKVLNVMKGLWNHMLPNLPNAIHLDRAIKTCTSLTDYEILITQLFQSHK